IILDQHVHSFDEPQKQRLSFGLLVIEGDTLLVAVDVPEIGVALAAVAPGAHRIPFARALELDDFGPISARIIVQNGPAMCSVRSSTLSPSSGPAISTAATILPLQDLPLPRRQGERVGVRWPGRLNQEATHLTVPSLCNGPLPF